MPLRVTRFEPTPNPNAVKCLVEPRTGDAIRSYFKPADAAQDPLAAALFAIPGVTNVMIQPAFITVCKSAGTPWPATRDAIARVLAGAAG